MARWSTRGGLLILVAIAGSLGVGFVRMTWTLNQIQAEQVQEQARVAEAQAVAVERKGEAEFRQSDVYVEQAAREQLGYARDGETVLLPTVVIPAPSAPSVGPQASIAPDVGAAEAAAPQSNLQRWWRALFPGAAAQP